tara:strand:- start:4797 stop:4964 length:168 start_codon:yes stop_codon:yes gene_type:complete
MNQLELLEQIQEKGYNVVTCGSCGVVNIVESSEELHTCYDCEYESEPCDFPDLFY